MRLIKLNNSIKEGEILNKWLESRLIRHNKNILIATTGGTGSGKSYADLRIAEVWYAYHFNKKFPAENICFSIGDIMKRLTAKDLKKGELLVMEEAGANFNSLDFQKDISKVFTFVLQSFRSMNVGILFNLPVLSMLNKSARLLLHAQFITDGINYNTKTCRIKPFFRQVNQQSGKVYEKYLRVHVGNGKRPIKRFIYRMPSDDLIKIYEQKKFNFVSALNTDFVIKIEKLEKEHEMKMGRAALSEVQQEVFNLLQEGYAPLQIAEIRGTSPRPVYDAIKRIKNKGLRVEKRQILLEKRRFSSQKPLMEAILT